MRARTVKESKDERRRIICRLLPNLAPRGGGAQNIRRGYESAATRSWLAGPKLTRRGKKVEGGELFGFKI